MRFRVSNSRHVDYIYIRYESGVETFEVETGALQGTAYRRTGHVQGVDAENLMQRISRIVFGLPEPAQPPVQLSFDFKFSLVISNSAPSRQKTPDLKHLPHAA